MTSHKQRRPPSNQTEFEDQNPVELGRGGHCNVALEVLLELYPGGEPYKLTDNGKDYAHVFLMFNGKPLDICGVISLGEMKTHYKNDSLFAKAISLEDVQKYFHGHQSPEETMRLKAHFKKHIFANLEKKFPTPQTLNVSERQF